MANGICPKCESDRWMVDLKMALRSEPIVVFVTPATLWDGAKGASKIQKASMCADCSYTEFYADNPQAVWAEWRKQNN